MWLTLSLGGGGGLQRRFFSGAGAAKLPDGLFFSTRTTPPDSALSLDTRCLSCQPTCGDQSQGRTAIRQTPREEADNPG